MKRSFFDVRSPFFRSKQRRVVVTAAVLLWALFELSVGQPFWALLFGAAGAYLVWQFFVVFDEAAYSDPETKDEPK